MKKEKKEHVRKAGAELTAEELAGASGGWGISDLVHEVKHVVKKGAHEINKHVLHPIEHAAKYAYNYNITGGIEHAFNDAKHDVWKAGHEIANGFRDADHAVDHAISDAKHAIVKAEHNLAHKSAAAWHASEQALARAGHAIDRAEDRVEREIKHDAKVGAKAALKAAEVAMGALVLSGEAIKHAGEEVGEHLNPNNYKYVGDKHHAHKK
jgi:hypothetical protein